MEDFNTFEAKEHKTILDGAALYKEITGDVSNNIKNHIVNGDPKAWDK